MAEAVKLTTLRKFIKQKTGLRLESAAAEALAARMNDKIARIVERAAVLVEMQQESTLQLSDMQRAIEELEAPQRLDEPAEVFEVIEHYSVEELGELARRLERSLDG